MKHRESAVEGVLQQNPLQQTLQQEPPIPLPSGGVSGHIAAFMRHVRPTSCLSRPCSISRHHQKTNRAQIYPNTTIIRHLYHSSQHDPLQHVLQLFAVEPSKRRFYSRLSVFHDAVEPLQHYSALQRSTTAVEFYSSTSTTFYNALHHPSELTVVTVGTVVKPNGRQY